MKLEQHLSRGTKSFFQRYSIISLVLFIFITALIIPFILINSGSAAPQDTVSPTYSASAPTITSLAVSANSQTPSPTTPKSPGPNAAAITPLPSGLSDPTGNWSLVFSDEFDSNSLDTNKWVTCYWWDNNGCTNAGNNELEWYQPGNVSVDRGLLYLRAQKEVVRASDGKTYNYTSGMVTTGRTGETSADHFRFAFEYGYIEVRAKIPYGKSFWPSVWLLPVSQKWPPEIDIMELVGDYPMTVNMTTHFIQADGTNGEKGGKWSGPDFSAGFHVFGLNWTPQDITWYVDGIARQRDQNKTHVPAETMYLILNLAVGGNWPGNPDARTVFPGAFAIDYVRVWQSRPS
jgi:beta-glucanase (GH16 family)